MRTDKEVQAAAAVLAEKANGGKFSDPLFYNSEHQAFWHDVVRAILDPADTKPSSEKGGAPSVSNKDVEDFSGHCVYIRSVYLFTTRIWRDSDECERKTMEAIAPSIFADLSQLLGEYLIIAACRLTDPANDRGNENFTVELFVNSFASKPEVFKQLNDLHQRMLKLRAKIKPARHKLAAHADAQTIRSGKPLGAASWEEWDEFWKALRGLVRILNENTIGKPFEIDAGGVMGDAETLLKALSNHEHFEKLLREGDPTVKDACLKVALRTG